MARPTKTTTARGYGYAHKQRRARAARQVAAGRAICWRCSQAIPPGTPWDLGHDDNDRTQYRGPEHQYCNRSAPGRRRRRPVTAPTRLENARRWW